MTTDNRDGRLQTGTTPDEVIAFWREAGPDRWFAKDLSFDAICRDRFLVAHDEAAAGRLPAWEETPDGALALVILLDQMPRNMFRGHPRTWASDPQALAVSDAAIARGDDQHVDPLMRQFFYLPFMHSEDPAVQERSVTLYAVHGTPEQQHWARHHRDIVARFSRFPHRNAVLDRPSTPEEMAYLESDDFRG